ncbi:MAG: hypothetical protein ACPK85_00490 [Methanosarcina sp.]
MVKNLNLDNSAWADFLISKAALILVSIVLFAALFQLVAGFKDLEVQQQLDSLAWDFKTAVDEIGANNSQPNSLENFEVKEDYEEFSETFYCFSEKEIYQNLPLKENLKVYISGEYVCLETNLDAGLEIDSEANSETDLEAASETEAKARIFRSAKPFAFKVIPLNRFIIEEKLKRQFGTRGTKEAPLTATYPEIKAFLQETIPEQIAMNPEEDIRLKKHLIYVKDREGVSAFGCVLIYQ